MYHSAYFKLMMPFFLLLNNVFVYALQPRRNINKLIKHSNDLKLHSSRSYIVKSTSASTAKIKNLSSMTSPNYTIKNILMLPITEVQGIGQKVASKLSKLDIKTISDLLLHMPVNFIDRTQCVPSITDPTVKKNDLVTIELTVESIQHGRIDTSSPHCVFCTDSNNNQVVLKYFYSNKSSYMHGIFSSQCQYLFIKGKKLIVSGRYTFNFNQHSVTNPDYVKDKRPGMDTIASDLEKLNTLVYPLTEGVTSKQMHKYINDALIMLIRDVNTSFTAALSSTSSLNKSDNNKNKINPLSGKVNKFENDNKSSGKHVASQLTYHSSTTLSYIHPNNEWLNGQDNLANKYKLPSFIDALYQIHNAKDKLIVVDRSKNKAYTRLALDELIIRQTILYEQEYSKKMKYQQIFKNMNENKTSTSTDGINNIYSKDSDNNEILIPHFTVNDYSIGNSYRSRSRTNDVQTYYELLLSKLPFQLTSCQINAINEIHNDLSSRERMVRLLQGDVGSGKTIVAVMSILRVIESGKQVCLLAPTEILAKQHFHTIQSYFDIINQELSSTLYPLNNIITNSDHTQPTADIATSRELKVGLIIGSMRGASRQNILKDLKANKVQLLVGTHALLNTEVTSSFNSLALTIIDEEQRFGVEQRNFLSELTNTLFTTATPIPRSLSLVSGVQDNFYVSTLQTKLPIKRLVKTIQRDFSDLPHIISFVQFHIRHGTKIFWVTPSLNASANYCRGSSAVERFDVLNKLFPGKVGLIHGRMTSADKDDVIRRFSLPSHTYDDGTNSNTNNNSEQKMVDDSNSDEETQNGINILVATTVIEVGIDVPDASLCIIERADCFGLSQLHQIRGRIGRGLSPPFEQLPLRETALCVLLAATAAPLSARVTEKVQSHDVGNDSDAAAVAAVDAIKKDVNNNSFDYNYDPMTSTGFDIDITDINNGLKLDKYDIENSNSNNVFATNYPNNLRSSSQSEPTALSNSNNSNSNSDEKLVEKLKLLSSTLNMTNFDTKTNISITTNNNINSNSNDISYISMISDMSMNRLKFLCQSNDCFEIAEYDLQLRGMGDIFGHRQSGQFKYRVASMPLHLPLYIEAKKIAYKIFHNQYYLPSSSPLSTSSTYDDINNTKELLHYNHDLIKLLKSFYLRPIDIDTENKKYDIEFKQENSHNRDTISLPTNTHNNKHNPNNNNINTEIPSPEEIQKLVNESHNIVTQHHSTADAIIKSVQNSTSHTNTTITTTNTIDESKVTNNNSITSDPEPLNISVMKNIKRIASTNTANASNNNNNNNNNSNNSIHSNSGGYTSPWAVITKNDVITSTATATATASKTKEANNNDNKNYNQSSFASANATKMNSSNTSKTPQVQNDLLGKNRLEIEAWLHQYWPIQPEDGMATPNIPALTSIDKIVSYNSDFSMSVNSLSVSNSVSSDSSSMSTSYSEPLFIVIDTEATGLSTTKDEVIQLAAKVFGSETNIFNAYIKPQNTIVSNKIFQLTGISQSFLNDEGHTFHDAWCKFQDWIADIVLDKISSTSTSTSSTFTSSTSSTTATSVIKNTKTILAPEIPIIFIAHNGKKYDFKIIKSNYQRYFNKEKIQQEKQLITSTSLAISMIDNHSQNTENLSEETQIITQNEDSENWFWFETREDIHVTYKFLDSLEILKDSELWLNSPSQSTFQSSIKSTISSTELTSTMITPQDSNISNTITNNNEKSHFPNTKLPRPINHRQNTLYHHVIGTEFINGHNAVVDVEGLEAILMAKSVAPYWRSIARKKLF